MGKKLAHKQYYIVPWSPCPDPAVKITMGSYSLKSNCTIVDPTTTAALAGVEDNATLLIDGHGSDDDPTTIEIDYNGKPAKRNIVAMGQLIADFWQLPKTHVKIRMLSCWGKGFAKNLAVRLYNNHQYQSIAVAGYHHKVSSGAGRSPKTGRGTNAMVIGGDFKYKGDEDLPEKERISWFNGLGQVIDKPHFDKTISVETDDYG